MLTGKKTPFLRTCDDFFFHKTTQKQNSFHHISTCVGVSFPQFPNKITHDFPRAVTYQYRRPSPTIEVNKNGQMLSWNARQALETVDGGPVSTSWDLSNRTYINHGISSGISYQPQPGKRRISEASRVWLEKLTGKWRRISPGSILLMRGLVQMCWSIFIHFPWKNLGESYQHRFSGSKI